MPTGYQSDTAPNLPLTTWDTSAFINARYETDISLHTKSSTRMYLGSYQNRDFFKYFTPDPNEQYRQNQHGGDWAGLDQKFVGNWFNDHTLVIGMEFRTDQKQDYIRRYLSENQVLQPINPNRMYRNNRSTTSLYIEDGFQLSKDIQLILGVRSDVTSDGFEATSPRLAATYQWEPSTQLKFSTSQGFRFPNAYDKFAAFRNNYSASTEYVTGQEFVLEHFFTPKSRLIATVYHYDSHNVTADSYSGDGSSNTIVNGKRTTSGFEVEQEIKFEQGRRFRASGTVQKITDVDGLDMWGTPQILAKANYSFLVLNQSIRTGLEAQYIGKRLTPFSRQALSDVAIANLTFSTEKKWNGFSGIFSIKNIFDNHFLIPAYLGWPSSVPINQQESLRTDGRTFWLQASYDF